jgi:hypothetical protein
MAVADCHGLPVALCVESATPREVKLATNTLVQMIVPCAPQNLIGDNAYDSDKLDSELRQYVNTELNLSLPIVLIEKTPPRTCVACGVIADVGRSRNYLHGYRTSAGWLFATNDMLNTFLECFTWAAV